MVAKRCLRCLAMIPLCRSHDWKWDPFEQAWHRDKASCWLCFGIGVNLQGSHCSRCEGTGKQSLVYTEWIKAWCR
jgi:hypothetical protein